ncbi:MAG TPA: APC family permease [Stellaceae bacterium]|nr:APC family permease [Stellaceae bacterium]
MTAIAEAAPRHHLLRILGVSFGVAAALGDAIGSGILRSPGIIAGEVPGVSLILFLWALGGVQAGLGANIFSELATALPRSGGAYNYAHRAFGDIGGLIVGWATCLTPLAGIAAASVSFAEFLPALWPAAASHKIAVALALQLALYAANAIGLREGSVLQQATTYLKAGMLFAFMVVGAVLVSPAEPASVTALPEWHWANIVLAYQLICGAYSGWQTPTSFTGENIAPDRSIPRAMGYGVLITTLLYVGINATLLHALGQAGVAAAALPFTAVLERIGGPVPSILFALTAMVTVASTANINIMGIPRVLFALSEDGLLPRQLRYVNAGGSPLVGYAVSAAMSLGLALSGSFALVFGLIGTINALTDLLVAVAYFRLRRREPDLPRPFRAILHPVLPLAYLVIVAVELALFASADLRGGAVALGLGLICVPFALIARRGRVPPPAS